MKKMRRFFAIVVAMAMVLTMALPAMAASIKITKDETFEGSGNSAYTYNAYKIFDAKYESLSGKNTQDNKDTFNYPEDAKVSYFMATENPWISTVQGMDDYFTVTAAADGSGYNVVLKEGVADDNTTAKAIATALNAALKAETVSPTGAYAAKSITAGGAAVTVDQGYYLIVSPTASNVALVTTDVEMVEKNEYTDLLKEFTTETKTGDLTATADEDSSQDDSVQVGDTVSYTLTVYIPTGANQEMVVTDNFTSGLDPVLDNGVVKVTTTGFTGTPTVSAPADGKFTITLSATDVAANAGKTITFVYEAVVTADAWYQTEENTGKVKYGNNYESEPSKVDSKTYNLEIDKKAETSSGDSLKGAQFELYRTDTDHTLTKADVYVVALTDAELTAQTITKVANTVYYRVAASTETGATKTIDMTDAYSAVIYGLDGDSTYSVRETVAPKGYNKLTTDVDVSMGDSNHLQPVVNQAGSTLPSTGGIGTTIFYVAGTILVIAAGVVLVTRRRMEIQ